MKLRKLTPGMAVEIFLGILLPLLFVAPFFCAIFGLSIELWKMGWSEVIKVLFWLFPPIALGSLWVIILFGPGPVLSRPWLRRLSTAFSLVGTIVFLFLFLPTLLLQGRAILHLRFTLDFSTLSREQLWNMLVIGCSGPALVGMRYLPALWKGKRD